MEVPSLLMIKQLNNPVVALLVATVRGDGIRKTDSQTEQVLSE